VSYIAGSVAPRARRDNGIQPPSVRVCVWLSPASEVVKKFSEWTSIDRESFGLCGAGLMTLSQNHAIHVRTGYQARPAPQWHK
jgi:hypothetical protein